MSEDCKKSKHQPWMVPMYISTMPLSDKPASITAFLTRSRVQQRPYR